jgi:cellulose synthase operon protein C
MRNRSVAGIMMGAMISATMGASLGVSPAAARVDHLAKAQAALKTGDLRTAQIQLRNAVRDDPQNATSHFWLARVSLDLGDAVAAEREAAAARDRGFDPHQAVPLLAQSLLAQGRYNELLSSLQPTGKDAGLDASILVSRGYAQIGLRQLPEAKASFAQAENTAPDAIEPLLADARLAAAGGDLADASSKISRALTLQPKSVDARIVDAQLRRRRNDLAGAKAVLDDLLTEQPGVTQARLDRADLELATGKVDAARTDIDQVLKTMPGNVQAVYLGAVADAQTHNFKSADAALERIGVYLTRLPRGYYLQAIVKEQLGQIAQAEDAARKYLARAPEDVAAYKTLARIEFARHRPDLALDPLTRLASTGHADAEAYDLLGRAQAAAGQNQQAIASFQKAQSLAPDNIAVQTHLASARMGSGDPDAAVNELEHTLGLAPKQPGISEALFFAALGTGDLTKAGDALAKIHAAQGDNEITANLDGLYKIAQLDLTGAKATFDAVLKAHPDFMPAKVNLARVDSMMGDVKGAETNLTDILSKQPASDPALTLLVSLYVRQNRVPDAIAVLERAHTAAPDLPQLTASLGDFYIRSGSPQKAFDLVHDTKGDIASSTTILSLSGAANQALGHQREARSAYEQILRQDPSAAAIRQQLVQLLVNAGEYETARNVLSAGIAVAPRNYQAYLNLALVDLKAANIDTALATADRLRTQNRDFLALQALRGDVFTAANRPDDAVQAFAAAQTEAPSPLLASRLATAEARAGHPDQASKTLRDWLQQHSDDLVATQQLSEIDLAQRNLDDAATNLGVILQHKPHDPIALNNLAWIFQQKGNDTKARDLAHQAYTVAPSPQTADTLGWILTSDGNPQTGLPLLRQAHSGLPDPRIAYHYAVALNAVGDKEEAKKQLQLVVATKAEFNEKAAAQTLLDSLMKGG